MPETERPLLKKIFSSNSALHLNDPYNPNSSFLSQFALLESSSVDDDLASLKKELSGSSKVLSHPFMFSWSCSTLFILISIRMACSSCFAV